MFENGDCPLCERPERFFPELKKWEHWVMCEDLLTGSVGRKQTLLLIMSEHDDGCTHSIYAHTELYHVNCWLENYLAGQYYMISARTGQSPLNVDTVVGHYHSTIVVPDGTADVLLPAYKGPRRQAEITARARGFAERYEAGERPK